MTTMGRSALRAGPAPGPLPSWALLVLSLAFYLSQLRSWQVLAMCGYVGDISF